jgi:hypothetical protein
VRANSDDIKKILRRLKTGQTDGPIAIQDEQSALRKIRLTKLDFLGVLYGTYDPTAEEVGRKLKEIWQQRSERSKADFARLLNIPLGDIDLYFDGIKALDVGQIVAVTKIFNLPTDYFFRPTYAMRFAYWNEDLVKYSVLSLVRPKAAIHAIDNDGKFYGSVLWELATGICRLHDLLYSGGSRISHEFYEPDTKAAWYLRESIPDTLRSSLEKQYYKLLEQYPMKDDRTLVPEEYILKRWFYANDEYIARLIIEGIDHIDIESKELFTVNLRFMKDLLSRKVRMRGFNADDMRMAT